MGFIAIAGCGALGGALAHKLAGRDRVAEVRLIDPEGRIAQGKALDILQSVPSRTVLDPDHVRRRVDRGGGRRRRRSSGRWRVGKRARRRIRIDAGEAAGECLRSCADCVRRRRAARADRPRLQRAQSAPSSSARKCAACARVRGAGACGGPPGHERRGRRAADRGRSAERGSGGVGRSRCIGTAAVEPTGSTSDRDAHREDPEPLAAGAVRARLCGVARGRRTARPLQAAILVLRGAGARCRGTPANSTGCAVVAMPVELGAEGVRRVLEPSLTRQEQTLLENAIEM